MASKIIRENSQIIGASGLAAFVALLISQKQLEGWLRQKNFEFRTKNNIYPGIPVKEEENAKKFIYRLNHSAKVNFFRSNTIDFVNFGYTQIKHGSQIGLPVSYFAKTKQELIELSPPNGFYNYLGQNFSFKDIENKLCSNYMMNEFLESLLLSDDAKLFGLGHAIAKSNNFIISCLDNIIDFTAIGTAYCISYSRSRYFKMQLQQRKRLYLISGSIALACSLVGRIFSQHYSDKVNETQACGFGLDCCEGSVEYYEKMLNRNKILRKVLENGENLIDEQGNFLKQGVRVPFTEYQFFIKNFSLSISERKNICENELKRLIQKLDDQNTNKEVKIDKELAIFKTIRLRLESLKSRDQK